MRQTAREPFRFAHLTWQEVREAARAGKVILLPVGSTEEHGYHLPVDVDNLLSGELCLEAGRRDPENILVMPQIPYGYTRHVMDFPGTINIHWDHFVHFCLDVTQSLAHQGFKRIVIVDGHGSNEPLLEFVARETNLTTTSICASFMWVNLVRELFSEIRESTFPGGAAHACELETSVYMHLCPERVQTDKIADELAAYHTPPSRFEWVDLMGKGPASIVEALSTATETGTLGEPSKASAEKGARLFASAASELVEFARWFRNDRPVRERVNHHDG